VSTGGGQGGSAYPKSIQAGIPKIDNPAGWPTPKIGALLKVVQRPVRLEKTKEYRLVTARRSRGGIVRRETLLGKDIATPSQFEIAEGDFLISRRQIAHGACGIVPSELAGSIVSNEYATLRPTSALDPGFLKHLTASIYFQQTCFHSSIGVHVEKLVFDLQGWLRWPIAVPEPPEQRRIAAVLDAWDEAIVASEKLARSKKKLLSSAADKQMEFWSDGVELGTLVRVNAASLPNATAPDFRFEYFPIGDDDEAGGWMTYAESPSRARRLARPGDIAYSTVRPLLRRLFVVTEHPSAVFSTGYAILSPKERGDSAFIFHLMTSATIERQVHARVTGSGYPAISASDLKTMKIPKIPKDQRMRIGQTLTSASDEVCQLEALTTLLRNQKRGLMQGLLTGKLPVPKSIDTLLPGASEVAA
jgi:type I restriction enzyme S subunit